LLVNRGHSSTTDEDGWQTLHHREEKTSQCGHQLSIDRLLIVIWTVKNFSFFYFSTARFSALVDADGDSDNARNANPLSFSSHIIPSVTSETGAGPIWFSTWGNRQGIRAWANPSLRMGQDTFEEWGVISISFPAHWTDRALECVILHDIKSSSR